MPINYIVRRIPSTFISMRHTKIKESSLVKTAIRVMSENGTLQDYISWGETQTIGSPSPTAVDTASHCESFLLEDNQPVVLSQSSEDYSYFYASCENVDELKNETTVLGQVSEDCLRKEMDHVSFKLEEDERELDLIPDHMQLSPQQQTDVDVLRNSIIRSLLYSNNPNTERFLKSAMDVISAQGRNNSVFVVRNMAAIYFIKLMRDFLPVKSRKLAMLLEVQERILRSVESVLSNFYFPHEKSNSLSSMKTEVLRLLREKPSSDELLIEQGMQLLSGVLSNVSPEEPWVFTPQLQSQGTLVSQFLFDIGYWKKNVEDWIEKLETELFTEEYTQQDWSIARRQGKPDMKLKAKEAGEDALKSLRLLKYEEMIFGAEEFTTESFQHLKNKVLPVLQLDLSLPVYSGLARIIEVAMDINGCDILPGAVHDLLLPELRESYRGILDGDESWQLPLFLENKYSFVDLHNATKGFTKKSKHFNAEREKKRLKEITLDLMVQEFDKPHMLFEVDTVLDIMEVSEKEKQEYRSRYIEQAVSFDRGTVEVTKGRHCSIILKGKYCSFSRLELLAKILNTICFSRPLDHSDGINIRLFADGVLESINNIIDENVKAFENTLASRVKALLDKFPKDMLDFEESWKQSVMKTLEALSLKPEWLLFDKKLGGALERLNTDFLKLQTFFDTYLRDLV